MQDCIIVGGGPAGLTAALYLARFLRRVTVFDSGDSRAAMIPKTHNMPPFPDGIPGPDLLKRMRIHARRYGAAIETGMVVSVSALTDGFCVATDSRIEKARAVIFAAGVFNHRPSLSRKDHDLGLTRGLIRYCPVCDAFEVRDKQIAVLGHGAHALREARFVRDYSASVTLISPDGAPAISRDGVGAVDAPLASLVLSEAQVVVTLTDGDTRHFDTLYVALGTSARTGLAARLDVHLGETGHIHVDAKQRTNIDRVYAIGDITEGLDQITAAMGQAAIAATAVHNDLRMA